MTFKIGDRVAVYGFECGVVDPMRGRVCTIVPSGMITVTWDDGNYQPGIVHPKQCRLLRKKFRRRIWLNTEQVDRVLGNREDNFILASTQGTQPSPSWTEFVEVRKRK